MKTFRYNQKPDGTWEKTVEEAEVNLADYQRHQLEGLEGVNVGVRHEEGGKVIIPPPEREKDA